MSSSDNPVALLKIMITISFEMADIMSILYPEPRKTRTILFISGHSIKTVHTQAMALENRQAVACWWANVFLFSMSFGYLLLVA